MSDLLGILLTVLLLGANAFFVGSEFALISARRDRLEALAEQGKHSAVTVIRVGENLSLMLAGAQLGITVCSILLGRIGEPAVAHLLEKPFHVVGIPQTLLHTVSFVIAITIVVVLHVLLGEMVPKNIAIAGPESTAMRLIPAYLIWMRVARPFIAFYNWCANITLRAMGVQVKDELDVTVSTVELSEMIAESLSEGLLDPEEHLRLTRALQIRDRVVADVAVPLDEIHAVPVAAAGSGPTVYAIERALAETGYSRFPIIDLSDRFIGYLHIKDVLRLIDNPDAVVDRSAVRPLPRVRDTLPLPDALTRLRRNNSHLALVTNAHGDVVAMAALEDPSYSAERGEVRRVSSECLRALGHAHLRKCTSLRCAMRQAIGQEFDRLLVDKPQIGAECDFDAERMPVLGAVETRRYLHKVLRRNPFDTRSAGAEVAHTGVSDGPRLLPRLVMRWVLLSRRRCGRDVEKPEELEELPEAFDVDTVIAAPRRTRGCHRRGWRVPPGRRNGRRSRRRPSG